MFRSAFASLLILISIGLLEQTFLSAAVGGRWLADGVLALALVWLTMESRKNAISWILTVAVVRELFSRDPFGVAVASTVLGLAGARLLLFSVLTHRAPIARGLSIVAGMTATLFGSFLFRSLRAIFTGETSLRLLERGAFETTKEVFFSTLLSLLLLALFARFERHWRWLFGKRVDQVPYLFGK